MFAFTKDHPLHESHATKLGANNDKVVPNFIGATLPRCDKGDREYYCSMMLALFKPWRSRIDLKTEAATWDEMFMNHGFTKRQRQLVSNFNIRYECLDARDDYRAQPKKNSTNAPIWDSDILHTLGESSLEEDATYVNSNEIDQDGYLPSADLLNVGRGELKRQQDMVIMRSVMINAGWTMERPGSMTDIDLNPQKPVCMLSGNDWKAEVQKMRQEVIQQHSQHIPMNKDGSVLGTGQYIPNEVKVVDKCYLEKSFHAGEHQQVVDSTASKFHLNVEQERVFRIVANHAVSPYADQLKLYIGGMGGTGKSQVLKALSQFFALQNESYRFLVVAPMGSTAALLGGSTYHYMFGINNRGGNANVAQVRSRLQGIEYVFIDEVSMLSACDLYKISS